MLRVFPAVASYKLERTLHWPKTLPISLTLSVTNKCNSKCRTCSIWKYASEEQDARRSELTTEEYSRIFATLGKRIIWVTVSGGEPYLRRDLMEICAELHSHCTPSIINIATNGLLPDVIRETTKKILQTCKNTIVIVNLSIDGIWEEHDGIRGIPGNFDRALETYVYLRDLKTDYSNLRTGIHSVISQFNIQSIPRLYDYIHSLGPDSYITEIAENRAELFNMDEKISPSLGDYEILVQHLLDKMRRDSHNLKTSTSKLIQAFRMLYQQMVIEELSKDQQIIQCFAGYASAQIASNGDVWPCSVLGHNRTMGNLREYDYDFKELWRSKQAEEVREWIRRHQCHCQLANAYYTNILCSFSLMPKVFLQYLKNGL